MADQKISARSVKGSLTGTEKIPVGEATDPAITPDQIAALAVTLLRNGVASPGDTLKKLYDLIIGLGELVGGWNTALLPTTGSGIAGAIDKGDYWRITGTITIAGIGDLKAGDMLIASVTGATVAADFFAVQNNVDLATASVLGLVKLYVDLSASNTDGAPSQSAIVTALGLKQDTSGKDSTGGYAGLTLFKINFKNSLNTFTSFFTNANTAARTYTFKDRDGTILDNKDIEELDVMALPDSAYTLVSGDKGKKYSMSPTVARLITIPPSMVSKFYIELYNDGPSTMVITAGAGVTFKGDGVTLAPGGACVGVHIGLDVWRFNGNLS